MAITRPNEVSIFANYYPLIGDVKLSDVSGFAPKQVIGDYTKDSERILSTWASSDHTGGIGVHDMKEAQDANRSYWSNCELDFQNHLLLPPLTNYATAPVGVTDDITAMCEFDSYIYMAMAVAVYRGTGGAWANATHNLLGTPTDTIVHKGKLYWACGTDFERQTTAPAWTTGATLSGGAVTCKFFCEWNNNLFILDNTGVLKWSADEGVTWTTNASSGLAAGDHNSLFVFRDPSGDSCIFMGTKTGLYMLDYDSALWIKTGLTFPTHASAGKGTCQWRGKAYIPVGMGIYQYDFDGTITPMGPDQDYGIPNEYQGTIVKLIPEHNDLYACVDSLASGSAINNSIMKWNDNGGVGKWRVPYTQASLVPFVTAIVASVTGYRLWVAEDYLIHWMALNGNLLNPLQITSYSYAIQGTHIWPWFDADNSVVDKLVLNLTAFVTGTSATQTVMIYYGTNADDTTWTLLTTAAFPDGKIDANGEVEFSFGSGVGLSVKSIRFKAVFAKVTNDTASPDVQWMRMRYQKLLDPQYAFKVRVDCGRDYRHKRASTLLANLKTAHETQTLGDFTYRTYRGTSTSHNVKISQYSGVVEAGRLQEGLFDITLISL